MLLKKLSITLLIVLTFITHTTQVFASDVLLGGESIGIELHYDGVLITGTYDISIDNKIYNPKEDGYKVGDLIVGVNDLSVSSISNLMKIVEQEIENNKKIILKVKRDNKTIRKELKYQQTHHQFSTGLYVQDGLAGIGTMTYYDPATHRFAALGHLMNDVKLSSEFISQKGKIYNSYVKKMNPSQNGQPGEKIAEIGTIEIGTVLDNNNYGIYGLYDQSQIKNKTSIATAHRDEVKKGKAYFLTVLNGHEIVKCNIQITALKKQNKPDIKGITFEITDKKVLSLTNGVVQGMSGSPIIQDGKLIGCVTHVNVNHVHQGYGLYIDWMLQNNGEKES